jgi:hypothetical protein
MAQIKITDSTYLPMNKIQAIKSLRTATLLGFREAKDAIENLPYIYTLNSYEDIDELAKALNREGFSVEGYKSEQPEEVETAFKSFLCALINAGEYDKVIHFIKANKAESVGRRLEPV